MLFKRLLSLAALIMVSLTGQAGTADHWQTLQKMAVAAHVLNYQGIFVCQTGAQSKSVEIKHIYNGHDEFARNVVLDGSPREVFNQSGDVVIYNPKHEKIVIEKRRGQNMFPAILPTDLDSIKANYTLKAGDIERVADRQAQILILESKDNLRYSYKFWVDSEYGLLLKSVMLNNRNEALDSMAFTQITLIKSMELDWYQPKIDSKKAYVMEDVNTIADKNDIAHWRLKGLPEGFVKVEQMMRAVKGKTWPVTHVIFSDGLASVSLFIEPLENGIKPRNGRSLVGNTSFYANVAGNLQVTVVGEVPEVTVAKIAHAVVFVK